MKDPVCDACVGCSAPCEEAMNRMSEVESLADRALALVSSLAEAVGCSLEPESSATLSLVVNG